MSLLLFACATSIPPDAVEFGGRKYRVYKQAATWGAAKILCESAGGHLATITSPKENRFVTRLVRQAAASAWIGMSDQLVEDPALIPSAVEELLRQIQRIMIRLDEMLRADPE